MTTGRDRFDRIMRQRSQGLPIKNPQFSGFLGITTGGNNVVEIPGRPGFVWVRLRNVDNEIIQAFNEITSPVFNLPVLVERDLSSPTRYKVVGRDTDVYGSNWGTSSVYLARHGAQHSFGKSDPGTGGDVTWIYSDQILPFLVTPSGSYGAGSVLVWSFIYHDDDGNYHYAGNTGTASLLGNKPTGSSNARMSLVYLDTSTGNPSIQAGTTEFAATITGTAAVLPYIPSVPDNDDIALAGVRLVSGTSSIGWSNLYDIREFIHKHPSATGTSGGGGHTIQEDGVGQTQRTNLNFVGDGFEVWDDAGNDATIVSGTAIAGTQGPPGEPGGILVYDNSVFQVTGTAISFNETLGVIVTGSHAFVRVYGEGARVYNSSNISIDNATQTQLTFDSERYDTDLIHSTVANTSRLTCQTAGKYAIFGGVRFASGAANTRRLVYLLLNGNTVIAQTQETSPNAQIQYQTIGTIYDLSVGEYVELQVYQDSGSALNVEVAANYSPEFMIQRIG